MLHHHLFDSLFLPPCGWRLNLKKWNLTIWPSVDIKDVCTSVFVYHSFNSQIEGLLFTQRSSIFVCYCYLAAFNGNTTSICFIIKANGHNCTSVTLGCPWSCRQFTGYPSLDHFGRHWPLHTGTTRKTGRSGHALTPASSDHNLGLVKDAQMLKPAHFSCFQHVTF